MSTSGIVMSWHNHGEPENHIWSKVLRDTFYRDVDDLASTKHIPDPCSLSASDVPIAEENSGLPFDVERRLADDLAFISAHDNSVKFVTATTILPKPDKRGLDITLAANSGVDWKVRDAMAQIVELLQQRAKKSEQSVTPKDDSLQVLLGIERRNCANKIFDLVVDLDEHRILGRLESRHWTRPCHYHGPPRKPLTDRLRSMSQPSSWGFEETHVSLRDQTEELCYSFDEVEKASREEIQPILNRAIKCSYTFTHSGFNIDSLANKGFSIRAEDKRDFSEVNKLGNYWRLSRYLAYISGQYRSLFSNIQLTFVDPFTSINVLGTKRYVHAEVQMVIYHENLGSPTLPRVIGSSKESCFLCHSFVRAHGHFKMSKAHCQVYNKWAVPELPYSSTTMENIRKTLVAVHQDILRARQEFSPSAVSKRFPLQSSVDLTRPSVGPPSISVTSVSSSTGSTETITEIECTSHPRTPIPLLTPRRTNSSSNTLPRRNSVSVVSLVTPEVISHVDSAALSHEAVHHVNNAVGLNDSVTPPSTVIVGRTEPYSSNSNESSPHPPTAASKPFPHPELPTPSHDETQYSTVYLANPISHAWLDLYPEYHQIVPHIQHPTLRIEQLSSIPPPRELTPLLNILDMTKFHPGDEMTYALQPRGTKNNAHTSACEIIMVRERDVGLRLVCEWAFEKEEV